MMKGNKSIFDARCSSIIFFQSAVAGNSEAVKFNSDIGWRRTIGGLQIMRSLHRKYGLPDHMTVSISMNEGKTILISINFVTVHCSSTYRIVLALFTRLNEIRSVFLPLQYTKVETLRVNNFLNTQKDC